MRGLPFWLDVEALRTQRGDDIAHSKQPRTGCVCSGPLLGDCDDTTHPNDKDRKCTSGSL